MKKPLSPFLPPLSPFLPLLSPSLPLIPDLSIDAMDVSGEHHLDVDHSVFKQRLTLEGEPIPEEPEQYQIGAGNEEEGENNGEGKEGGEKKEATKDLSKCERYM